MPMRNFGTVYIDYFPIILICTTESGDWTWCMLKSTQNRNPKK